MAKYKKFKTLEEVKHETSVSGTQSSKEEERVAELEYRFRDLLKRNSEIVCTGRALGVKQAHSVLADNEHEIALIRNELKELDVNAKPSHYRT